MAKSVVVVGGGIVGCMTAMKLHARGCDVAVVERNQIAAQTSGESSWAGSGILFPLLPWFYEESVNQLTQYGARVYPELLAQLKEETGIDPEYIRSGMLLLPPFDSTLARHWCQTNGVETEVCDLKNFRYLSEALQEAEGSGLLIPSVAQVRPPHVMQALKKNLQQKNVKLLEHTQLKALHNEAARELNAWQTTTGEYLEADAFVVTSGAWSFELLKNTTNVLDIKPMRGQILLYQLPPGTLQHIVFRDDFYLVPRRDGYLLAGSTLEDVGFDPRTTEDVKAEIQRKAEAIMPMLKGMPILKHWSGLRPGTPKNLPTIAAHMTIKNLFMNTGHFRYGLTMAPASAERVADLICR